MNCSSGKGIEFFTAVNEAYLDYARALENSIRINTGMELMVYTINCSLSDAPNHKRVDCEIAQGMEGKYTCEQAFCMRYRALVFSTLLKAILFRGAGSTMLYWIDADSLVRRPGELIQHSVDCEITARQNDRFTYASGVLGISTNALEFAHAYYKLVKRDSHWKADQRCLSRALHEFNYSRLFKPLPKKYCDTAFEDDSTIWTAKIKHHNHPKWLKEYEHYLSQ
jgi:hypothetical protein